MDAQHIEKQLLAEADKAEEAWLAEEDEAKKLMRKQIWTRKRDALESFRCQQVAAGEDPNQGCKA